MSSSPDASIIIIGAGIIGTSIAYNLTTKFGFKNVAVFDRAKAGSGSTSAALGGFRHQFSNELSIRMSKESIRIIENFKELTGYDPLMKRDGYLFVASTEKSYEGLKRNRSLAVAQGIPVDLLSRDELQKRFPFYSFDEIIGGTLCMEDGHASTLAVLQGYFSKSKEKGVRYYENAEVTKILRDDNSVLGVRAEGIGEVRADKVVIASGAYSGLVGRLASVLVPIKPYPRKILVTHSFSDGIPSEIPIIIDVDSTLAIGREGSGMIMADNEPTESSFELVFNKDYEDRVISKALCKVPALSKASISYADMGLYEMTPDSNPIISEINELSGLYCCAGFAGHGFMHAPVAGELMAEMIAGSKPHLDISSFDIERFKDGKISNEGLII